ncbi:MAG: GDP-mannose 4,6-dehydratase [Desulfarculus sp.]|nr:GDP-mannose 4,6-dehydratase [Desulfarculus sp.]
MSTTVQSTNKTVLITGGAGFIGSNFVHYLYERFPQYRIIVLDCLTYAGSIRNLPEAYRAENDARCEFWYGNVRNAELVNTLVSQANIVVHFAAETHVTRSIYDNLLFFETDVLGTQVISNAVLKYGENVERFVHISTSEVYGTALDAKMNEDHPLSPMSPYASAKCGADRLVFSYWATYQIPAVIIRPFNNYGPRQHLEKVIPRFVTSVVLGEKLTVHGDGSAARDFIHVEDTCRGIDMVMHAPLEKVVGQVFNLASGEHRSIVSIATDVVEAMGYDPGCITYIGDRPGQVFRHTGDYSKIKRELGWEPRLSWSDGLRDTIAWYVNNREWWERQLWMRAIPIVTRTGKREMH